MKNVFVLTLVVGATLATSCKKSYDCECRDIGSTVTEYKTGKGKNADDACNDIEDRVLGTSIEECIPSK